MLWFQQINADHVPRALAESTAEALKRVAGIGYIL